MIKLRVHICETKYRASASLVKSGCIKDARSTVRWAKHSRISIELLFSTDSVSIVRQSTRNCRDLGTDKTGVFLQWFSASFELDKQYKQYVHDRASETRHLSRTGSTFQVLRTSPTYLREVAHQNNSTNENMNGSKIWRHGVMWRQTGITYNDDVIKMPKLLITSSKWLCRTCLCY